MNAYTDAHFGMVKKLTQKVEALWSDPTKQSPETTDKKNKSIDLFEEDIYLHFY